MMMESPTLLKSLKILRITVIRSQTLFVLYPLFYVSTPNLKEYNINFKSQRVGGSGLCLT